MSASRDLLIVLLGQQGAELLDPVVDVVPSPPLDCEGKILLLTRNL